MSDKIRKGFERSDICKCGHNIQDHQYAGCNHEVGSLCMTNECGGKCYKCKCKKFDAKIRKKKPTEIEKLTTERDAWRDMAKAGDELLEKVGASFNLGDDGYTWHKEYRKFITAKQKAEVK
jgi:hypothetical protein